MTFIATKNPLELNPFDILLLLSNYAPTWQAPVPPPAYPGRKWLWTDNPPAVQKSSSKLRADLETVLENAVIYHHYWVPRRPPHTTRDLFITASRRLVSYPARFLPARRALRKPAAPAAGGERPAAPAGMGDLTARTAVRQPPAPLRSCSALAS